MTLALLAPSSVKGVFFFRNSLERTHTAHPCASSLGPSSHSLFPLRPLRHKSPGNGPSGWRPTGPRRSGQQLDDIFRGWRSGHAESFQKPPRTFFQVIYRLGLSLATCPGEEEERKKNAPFICHVFVEWKKTDFSPKQEGITRRVDIQGFNVHCV